MKINFEKFEAGIKNNKATFWIAVNAPQGDELQKENARVTYKAEATFDSKDKTKVKSLYIVGKDKVYA